jgi:hypothetical protein
LATAKLKEIKMFTLNENKTREIEEEKKYGFSDDVKKFANDLLKDKKKCITFMKKHGFIDENNKLHPN